MVSDPLLVAVCEKFGILVQMKSSHSNANTAKSETLPKESGETKSSNVRGSYKAMAVTSNAKPRIQIRQDVVNDLVAWGVPDRLPEIARAVNEITRASVARGNACLTDLGDIAALDAALVDRLDALARLHVHLLAQLSELVAIQEDATHNALIQTLIRRLPK